MYTFWEYFVSTLAFFTGLAIIIGGAIAAVAWWGWPWGVMAAIVWVLVTGSAYLAFLFRATDH